MKRIVKMMLLCAAVCCPLLVKGMVPWAEDKNAYSPRQEASDEEEQDECGPDEDMYSLLPFIVREEKIRIVVDISNLKHQGATEQKFYQEKVEGLFQQWFENALSWIEVDHREKEFEDIIPLLRKGINGNGIKLKNSCRTSEVRFVIYETKKDFQKKQKESEGTVGLFIAGDTRKPIRIYVSLEAEDAVWSHEIGHAWGFVDEYGNAYNKYASSLYGSARRPILSIMEDRIIPEEEDEEKFTGASEPSCEDSEGLINMLDAWTVRLKKDRHPEIWPDFVSERIKNGWKSFEMGLDDFYLLGSSIHKLFENLDKLPQPEREIVQRALWENQDEIQLTEKDSAFLERYRQETDDQLKRTFRMKRIGLK